MLYVANVRRAQSVAGINVVYMRDMLTLFPSNIMCKFPAHIPQSFKCALSGQTERSKRVRLAHVPILANFANPWATRAHRSRSEGDETALAWYLRRMSEQEATTHYRVWIDIEGVFPRVGNFEATSFDDAAAQALSEASADHCQHDGKCAPACAVVTKVARLFSRRPNSHASSLGQARI